MRFSSTCLHQIIWVFLSFDKGLLSPILIKRSDSFDTYVVIMGLKTIYSAKSIKIFGYLLSSISIILISREIYHFLTLPSTADVPDIIDIFKYKENTIGQGYLWIQLMLLGYGLTSKNKIGWIIPQSLLLTGFVPFIWILIVDGFSGREIVFFIIGLVYLIFCIFVIRFFLMGRPREFFKIDLNKVKFYYPLIIVIAAIYWIIESVVY